MESFGDKTRAQRGNAWVGLVLAVLLSACAGLPEVDLNPLLRVEHMPGGAVEIEALGPLIDVRVAPTGTSHALRPLYQHKANGIDKRTDFLAPFGCYQETRTGASGRLWPLIWSGERTDGPDGSEWDFLFFPIIFTGAGPNDGDGYFALFPLAGRTKQLFGMETFDFILWPLFMRSHMNVTEPSTNYSVLLLFGWTEGGLRDGSFRVLPFYRRAVSRTPEGGPRKILHTAPWPFYTWGERYEDTDSPSRRKGLWPLYSWEESDAWFKSTWLWPFFRVNRSTEPGKDEFLHDLPWPFFRNARSAEGSTFRVWPFYMRFKTANSDSMHVLWPFGRDRRWEPQPEGGWGRRDVNVIPFWHHSRLAVRDGDDVEWQAWPFAHSTRRVSGERDTGSLSLVPFRHVAFMRPMDELYGFLWTLWRHRSNGTVHETRWLFDTTFHRRSPEGERVSVPFLYASRPETPDVQRHQALWGLSTWRTDDQGLQSASLLGLDVWTR